MLTRFSLIFSLIVGQSYEIRMLNRKLMEYSVISSKYVKVGGRLFSSSSPVWLHDRTLSTGLRLQAAADHPELLAT